MISINHITKYINEKKIIDDVSFNIYEGDKTGLIGINGVGKSTLLNMIIGKDSYYSGSIRVKGQIGYLPQDLSSDKEKTVEEFLEKYINDKGISTILKNLNIKSKYNQQLKSLSGGEKTRVYLAKAILSKANILILDEPTNHLDSDGIQWLSEFISKFHGCVLIVSHDRYFLDQTVTNILELDEGNIKEYKGNYSNYKRTKDKELEKQAIEYEKYKKERKRLEIAARKQMERANKYNNMSQNDFYRGKAATIAKKSKAIASRIEKLDKVEKPKEVKGLNISFDNQKNKVGNILIKGENIKKTYNDLLFKNVNFEITRGKRIGIIGKNGVGKTTLLKGIIGSEELEGNLYISPSTKMGYFSQELKNLNENLSILDEMRKHCSNQSYIRTLLGCMLFKGEDIFKKIGDLSFGERVRVAFLKLVLEGNNLLVLDEPTNFLDITSREKIEEILIDYEGAILFVSHDQYFVEKMAEEIWEIEDNKLNRYLGDYEYYLSKKIDRNENQNLKKEQILNLEMELSSISFKLNLCKEEEKEELEKRYFEISKKLNQLKR